MRIITEFPQWFNISLLAAGMRIIRTEFPRALSRKVCACIARAASMRVILLQRFLIAVIVHAIGPCSEYLVNISFLAHALHDVNVLLLSLKYKSSATAVHSLL